MFNRRQSRNCLYMYSPYGVHSTTDCTYTSVICTSRSQWHHEGDGNSPALTNKQSLGRLYDDLFAFPAFWAAKLDDESKRYNAWVLLDRFLRKCHDLGTVRCQLLLRTEYTSTPGIQIPGVHNIRGHGGSSHGSLLHLLARTARPTGYQNARIPLNLGVAPSNILD